MHARLNICGPMFPLTARPSGPLPDLCQQREGNVSVLGQSGLFSRWVVSAGVSREQELHNVATGEERGL
jgi:hypothetical protein